jgi:hypothetical protein
VTLHRSLLLTVVFLFAFVGAVWAQDDTVTTDDDTTPPVDDDTGTGSEFAATLAFVSPTALEGNIEYEFEFKVTNTTTPSSVHQWISIVDLYMPTSDYSINPDLASPDALHGGQWNATLLTETDSSTAVGIRWEFTLGVSSMAYGDIREGEDIDFSFRATTDGSGTDGFDFKITADSANFVSGTAYIGEEPDDDTGADDTGADDTVGADDAGDDDDDDSSSGCGC